MSAIINFPFTSFLGVKTPEERTFLVFPIGLRADSGYLGFTENISNIPDELNKTKSKSEAKL